MTNRKELLREFLLMNLGTLLVSVGVYFFKLPNHFSMGGVSGLAVLLGKLLPQLSPSTFNTIINVLFLVLGFVMLNRGFGARTVYCSILSAGLIQLFEWAFPMDRPLTDQLMLELFFAVILPALGSAILFNIDASSGGTDIAAMILKKYTGLDVGRALLLSDVVIAAAALFVFDITAGLCSLLGLALKSVLVDSAIESFNRRKAFFVISYDPEHVCDYITHTLGRGATVWQAQGAYTHAEHHVVLTVLTRGQAVLLRRYLKKIDPHAFLIVANSSEIFGKGFLQPRFSARPDLNAGRAFLLCRSRAKLALCRLTAARPWDDSAWVGTAHMRKHFMRLSLCVVSRYALCARSFLSFWKIFPNRRHPAFFAPKYGNIWLVNILPQRRLSDVLTASKRTV